jgi:hypothetical protein
VSKRLATAKKIHTPKKEQKAFGQEGQSAER